MPLDAGLPARAEAGPGTKWNVLVDRDGNRVSGAHREGLFWARPPIEVLFAGFVGHPRPTANSTLNGNQHFQQFKAKDLAKLKLAVFDLSQTRPGRKSLWAIRDNGYCLAFDLATGSPYVDHDKRMVFLRSGVPVSSMQNSIGHEGRHIGDNSEGLQWHTGQRLADAKATSFLLEALSRTREAEHAAHCVADPPGYPAGRYRPRGVLGSIQSSCAVSDLGDAIRQNLASVDAGDDDGFRRKILPVFYAHSGSTDFYTKSVLDAFDRALAKRATDIQTGRPVGLPIGTEAGPAETFLAKLGLATPELAALSGQPASSAHAQRMAAIEAQIAFIASAPGPNHTQAVASRIAPLAFLPRGQPTPGAGLMAGS